MLKQLNALSKETVRWSYADHQSCRYFREKYIKRKRVEIVEKKIKDGRETFDLCNFIYRNIISSLALPKRGGGDEDGGGERIQGLFAFLVQITFDSRSEC